MALYEERFRKLMDLKMFVMTDDDIRLKRRI
jgi:uridine kinase